MADVAECDDGDDVDGGDVGDATTRWRGLDFFLVCDERD